MQLGENRGKEKSQSQNPELLLLKVKVLRMEEPYIFQLEIPKSASLIDLHEAIQRAMDFDNDHLFDFFSGRNERSSNSVCGRNQEIWEDASDDYYDLLLEDIYPLPNKFKLYYLFDYGDNWLFEIAKQRKKPVYEATIKYPRVVSSTGVKPKQYPDYDEEYC